MPVKTPANLSTLFDALDKQRREQYRREFQAFSQNFAANARREAAAIRALDRVHRQGALKLGIDLNTIEKLHTRDDETALAFQARQTGQITREVRQLSKKRRARVLRVAKLKERFNNTKGNPRTTVCLWQATRITMNSSTIGSGASENITTQTGFGKNIFRGALKCIDWGYANIIVYYDFVWTPTFDGIMSAVGVVDAAGTYRLHTSGACLHDPDAGARFSGKLYLNQEVSSPEGVVMLGAAQPILDAKLSGGCSSKTSQGPLDPVDERSFSLDNFPIVAGAPLIASVVLVCQANASDGASSRIDAASDASFGLNVPTIWLIIDS